ncbi:MAG: response regulator [Limisphaerales bacterium]
MTKPLAVLLHEKMVPGSKLVTRFEELDYRVVTVSDPAELTEVARREGPMLVVADLLNRRGDVLAAIEALRKDEGTSHIPVIAYTAREDEKLREAALGAGVRILATDATILPHLPHFVEHALSLD